MSISASAVRPIGEMQKITPFLWFDANAEAAVEFYTNLFPDSEITTVARYPEGAPGQAGSVMTVAFTLFGQKFLALNGGPHFKFTEAISFVVSCETQAEVDKYWDALVEGGEPSQCGWLKDRFGLSWQITPTILGELMSDPERGPRAMQAMMGMVKLDIAALKAAGDGA